MQAKANPFIYDTSVPKRVFTTTAVQHFCKTPLRRVNVLTWVSRERGGREPRATHASTKYFQSRHFRSVCPVRHVCEKIDSKIQNSLKGGVYDAILHAIKVVTLPSVLGTNYKTVVLGTTSRRGGGGCAA